MAIRLGSEEAFKARYRLRVVQCGADMQLLALPSGGIATAEALVTRTGGQASGFLQLQLEPGWKLMRRTYGDRALGRIYKCRIYKIKVYRGSWPGTQSTGGEPIRPLPRSPRLKVVELYQMGSWSPLLRSRAVNEPNA